jgi:hypothetical protein
MAAILHKVKSTETMMSICLMYGLTYDQLVKLNTKFLGTDPSDLIHLHRGDVVVIGDSADPLDLVRVLRRKGRL